MEFANLVEICLWPHLAVKGLKASMLVAYKTLKRYTDFVSSSTGSDPLRVLHFPLIPDRLPFAVTANLILSHVFPDNRSALCYVEWVWQLTKFTRDTSPAFGFKERCWMRLAWRHRHSLRKHPFLLALCDWGRFARRNVCDSAAEIPYWWRKICPESGQKHWLVDGVVSLF